jgi:hypothetical protein
MGSGSIIAGYMLSARAYSDRCRQRRIGQHSRQDVLYLYYWRYLVDHKASDETADEIIREIKVL